MKRYYTDLIFMVSAGIFIFCLVMMIAKMPKSTPTAPSPSVPVHGPRVTSFKSTYTNTHLSVSLNKVQLKTPNVIVVAEDGSGDVKSLKAALDILENDYKVIVKSGKFELPVDLYTLPNFEIVGEGESTEIEITDGIYLSRTNLKISHMKIVNHSSLAAIRVTNNGKLDIQDVWITGNNTGSGVSVSGGNLKMKNVKMTRVYRGLDMDNPVSVDIHDVAIASADYGVYYRSDDDFSLHGLALDNIRITGVDFSKDFKGKLTCNDCQFTEKLTNVDERLLLGSHK